MTATPQCPPEIAYPWTARGRKQRARIFLLEGSEVPQHVLASLGSCLPIRWSPKEITLEVGIGDRVWQPLHLSSLRFALTDSLHILTPQALAGISFRERALLFAYAERQGLRTLCFISTVDASESVPDAHAFLADTILCEDAGVRDRLVEPAHGFVPQIRTWGDRLDLHSELIACPPLAISAPRGQQSALLESLRRGQQHLDRRDGVTWLTPGGDLASPDSAREGHDWLMLVWSEGERSRLADRVPRSEGAPANVAVLVLGEPLAGLDDRTCVEKLDLLTRFARIILFEEENAYRSFFARCCRLNAAIAILRRKAVLLAPHCDDDLFERLARCFRLKRQPRRSADLTQLQNSALPAPASRLSLSVCISTYNRADWLRVTLPLIARETAQWKNRVELLVVDNASTDDTELVAAELSGQHNFKYHRNARNVGMLGNLGVCAKHTCGDYIWILGDDDLVKPGTVSLILDAIASEAATELVYLNYAYTHFDTPEELKDVSELVARATPIAEPTPSGFYPHIWQMAAVNENFFTSIFACVFRRDHGLGAYTQYTDFPPFSNMQSAIPTTKYVLANMMDRPGYWIGTPAIVVNMNVSWGRYSPVWHIERFPEVFDVAEANGVPEADLRRYRESNLRQALHFLRELNPDDKYVRGLLSLTRYIESMKRAPGFARHADELLALYQERLVRPEGLPAKRLPAPTVRAVYDLRNAAAPVF
jgi:glycosyltransferase involved in cell wall biosynthesis